MTPPSAQSGSAAALPVQPEATWIGHPRGLLTLFMTEMWERFSYYGMRALLVLFMVAAIQDGGMGLTDQTATAIYGLYSAAVYLLSLPGGWMADRLMGAQRAIWYGGIVIMCGHFTLAIPGVTTFFLGLILIALGTGLLKPNISAVVGELYPPGDPRRDGGFTIYYMGINLGAFLGPLACGLLAAENWHYGFAAAGVGMLFGLIQFALTRKTHGDRRSGAHTLHRCRRHPVQAPCMDHGVCRAGRSRGAARRRPDGHDSIRRDQPLPKRKLRHRHRDRGLLRVHTWLWRAEIRGAEPDRHHRGTHLCRDGVLGGVRAGRLIPQPVRRTLYAQGFRQLYRARNLVPGAQPGLHTHSCATFIPCSGWLSPNASWIPVRSSRRRWA